MAHAARAAGRSGPTRHSPTRRRALAANQGLYNGFLVAGLVWGLLAADPIGFQVQVFFLACVIVAGVYGAATVSRRILVVQALPAALALAAVLVAGRRYGLTGLRRSASGRSQVRLSRFSGAAATLGRRLPLRRSRPMTRPIRRQPTPAPALSIRRRRPPDRARPDSARGPRADGRGVRHRRRRGLRARLGGERRGIGRRCGDRRGRDDDPGRVRRRRSRARCPSCVVVPELTEGPYYVNENLDRSDIRIDTSDGSVSEGAVLTLDWVVSQVDGNACIPLEGVLVDVWHCDAAGEYSDVGSEQGHDFLRGYQHTDAAGKARIMTIYPGWYQGRAVHIHFKIRTDAAGVQRLRVHVAAVLRRRVQRRRSTHRASTRRRASPTCRTPATASTSRARG